MYNAIGVSSPVGVFSTSFFPLLSDSPAATPFSSLFDDELVVSLSSLLLLLLLFEVESSLSSSSFDSDDASGTSLTSKCARSEERRVGKESRSSWSLWRHSKDSNE